MCRKLHISYQMEGKSHITKTVSSFSWWPSWSYSHICTYRKCSQILTPRRQYLVPLLKKIRCLCNCCSPGPCAVKQGVVSAGGGSRCCSCNKSFTLAQEARGCTRALLLKTTSEVFDDERLKKRWKTFLPSPMAPLECQVHLCHTERTVASLVSSWALVRLLTVWNLWSCYQNFHL